MDTLTTEELASHGHIGNISNANNHNHLIYGADDNNQGDSSNVQAFDTDGNSTFNMGYKRQTSLAGAHTHTITINANGGNKYHNNMQPYLVIYRYRRTV